eukprot:g6791.t1
MHPSIAEFPSRCFYDGTLTNGPATATHRPKIPGFPWPSEEVQEGGRSHENPEEAEALIMVGIITGYSAQQELLRRLWSQLAPRLNLQAKELRVDTVDGFQGAERDLILASTVRSFFEVGFMRDPRRVNVMLTRARRGLIVFGNAPTLHTEMNTRVGVPLETLKEQLDEQLRHQDQWETYVDPDSDRKWQYNKVTEDCSWLHMSQAMPRPRPCDSSAHERPWWLNPQPRTMRSLAAEVLPDLEEQDGKTRPWGRWAQHDLLEGPASEPPANPLRVKPCKEHHREFWLPPMAKGLKVPLDAEEEFLVRLKVVVAKKQQISLTIDEGWYTEAELANDFKWSASQARQRYPWICPKDWRWRMTDSDLSATSSASGASDGIGDDADFLEYKEQQRDFRTKSHAWARPVTNYRSDNWYIENHWAMHSLRKSSSESQIAARQPWTSSKQFQSCCVGGVGGGRPGRNTGLYEESFVSWGPYQPPKHGLCTSDVTKGAEEIIRQKALERK